jgi:oligopeptide transport system substrate-binding protein
MRVRTPFRVTAAAAVLALGLAACGGGDGGDGGSDNGSDAGAPAGEAGGTYSATLTEPSYLAPAQKCYESECSAVLDLLFEPLVSTDFETGELIFDGLAESIESNDDQTVWTIKLKEGRTFHNGEPVNADSFITAWNYSQNPKNAVETAGFMAKIEGAGKGKEMSGLKKVDDTTLEVTLSGPFSQFGQMMSYTPAFAPIAQECFDDLDACNESPIGTGPYKMDGKWNHDRGITVTKWAEYQGEQPAQADTIEFKMFSTPNAELRDFQNGGVDVIRPVASDIYLEAKAQFPEQIIEEESASLTYLGFPTTKAPFDNVKLRQAMSMAVDRELIVEQVLNGLAKPSTDIVTPPIPGSRDDACDYCEHNPEEAKKLFEESGAKINGPVQYYFNAGAGHDAWVEAAARQIQETLGIDYTLKATEWAQYLELLDAQEFTGPFRLGWSLDYPSPENYIRPIAGTNGDSNYSGYSNPKVDALLEKGDQATTLEESFEFYQQAGDIALEELPIMPMWSAITAIAYSDQVTDVRYDVGEGEVALGEVSVTQ